MNFDKTVDFMLEEYKQIANAYQDLHAQHNALVKSYLTLVALPVTVLAVVLKMLGGGNGSNPIALSNSVRVSIPIMLLFMFALSLVGYSVFRALIATRAEAIYYVRSVNCIRRFFVENSKDVNLSRYLVLPDFDMKMPPYLEGSETRYFWHVTMVQFLNSAISVATILAFLWWASLELKEYWFVIVRIAPFLKADYMNELRLLAPLGLGVFYFFFQVWDRDRILYKQENMYKPKFGTHKVIGVDLDGILADLAEGVIQKCNSLFKMKVCREEITSHDISQCLGLDREQFNSIFKSEDIFVDLKPVPESIKSLKLLHKKGWVIHIVTDRFWHDDDWSVSKKWLNRYKFNYDRLDIVRANEKFNYAPFNNILYFVEDNYDTAMKLSKVCENVFLLDEPYNQGDLPDNVIRVQKWSDIVGILKDKT